MALGCALLISLGALGAIISSISSGTKSVSEPSSTPPAPDPVALDLRKRATEKLLATADLSDAIVTARLCEQADLSKTADRIRTACGKAHVVRAQQELKGGRTAEARRLFNLAVAEGVSEAQKQSLEPTLKRAEAADFRKQQRLQAAAGAIARQTYAKALRERYLDQNLDIKVSVSGKENERITLAFALFNDVWAHKFQKGDLPVELSKMGFKRVDMTDNYDYHVYWNLK